jgi:hypothetical protein
VAYVWSKRSAATAAVTARHLLTGAAWGVAAHFVRDIATAPMAFWWPLSDVSVRVQYRWYILTMLVIIACPSVSRNGKRTARTAAMVTRSRQKVTHRCDTWLLLHERGERGERGEKTGGS